MLDTKTSSIYLSYSLCIIVSYNHDTITSSQLPLHHVYTWPCQKKMVAVFLLYFATYLWIVLQQVHCPSEP